MCATTRLSAADLQRQCRPETIRVERPGAETLQPAAACQERALEALRFGTGIRRPGYNLFAIGPSGVGKRTLLRQFLETRVAGEKTPSDWCYVHDFQAHERPRALELPAGTAVQLQRDMDQAVAELRVSMRAAFESDQHRARKRELFEQLKKRQEHAFEDVQLRARQRDIGVMETDVGIAIAALYDGKAIDPEKFDQLPEDQRQKLRSALEVTNRELQEMLARFHDWRREHAAALEALDRETAAAVARQTIDGVRRRYAELPIVLSHLTAVELDIIETAGEFLAQSAGDNLQAALQRALEQNPRGSSRFERYQVNVLVDNAQRRGAPVLHEDNPTYANLVGRIDHESQFGTLVTHFMLIRSGALHRAIGGYLVLDALKVIQQPFAWEALKRIIRSGEIRIHSPAREMGLVSTVSLDPAPVALGDTKLVLVGDRVLYYLLAAWDPEFLDLFKVLVDFDESIDRTPQAEQLYANLVSVSVQRQGLREFDAGAIARVIDRAARAAGDAEKLSVHMRTMSDLLYEADYWARERARSTVTSDDVDKAVEAQQRRAGRIKARLMQAFERGDVLVASTGSSIGQVNGLSVFQLGEHVFGVPTRISARVRVGRGEVIDIEREVELGGPIHSKGVLILAGFLGARYATRVPLAASATLVFEQSYASVEGDSASLAELCALLSALGDVPVKQSLALTGSVNQHGQVQSIGAVNEKVEAFFDVCNERGLNAEQGVLIPRSNVKNLVLRADVLRAIEGGRFHIHAIDDVDDALELLTGRPAGVRDGNGAFPPGSVNASVERRLFAFAESAREFGTRPRSAD